jgi:hypothetical protein
MSCRADYQPFFVQDLAPQRRAAFVGVLRPRCWGNTPADDERREGHAEVAALVVA